MFSSEQKRGWRLFKGQKKWLRQNEARLLIFDKEVLEVVFCYLQSWGRGARVNSAKQKDTLLGFLEKLSSSETLLFFKRWLRHPLQVGSVFPSSRHLAQRMCRHVILQSGDFVVELGGGTGGLTRVLLENLPASQLIVVEKDPILCAYLEENSPIFL